MKFFYTGSYRVAHCRPEVFRDRVPRSCLALIATAVNKSFLFNSLSQGYVLIILQINCVLDGYAKDGTGQNIPKFSSKSYSSIYLGMLSLIDGISSDPYHGPRLEERLSRWARDGW